MQYPLINLKAECRMAVPASDMLGVTLEWMRQELADGCQYAFEYFERAFDEDDYDDYYEPYDPLPQSAYDPYRYE